MSQIYEAMVLLDNDVVRQGYDGAKAVVTDALKKYDATIRACRRWDERRLAYPIRRKNRATYFISYFEMPGDRIPAFRRDLELNERVLRYLLVAVDELPEGEAEQSQAEEGEGFAVPPPPEDDAIEVIGEEASQETEEEVDLDELSLMSEDKED